MRGTAEEKWRRCIPRGELEQTSQCEFYWRKRDTWGCTMQGLDAQQGVENHTQPPQPGTGREQGENTLQLSMPLVISLKGNFADLTAFKSSLEPQQGWGTCLIQCKKSTFLSPHPPKGCPATAGKRGDSDTSRTVAALCACVTRFYQRAKPACPTDFESTWEGWQGAGHPHRTFHPTVEEYSFFSSMHGSFSRIDQIVGHKASLSKIKKKKNKQLKSQYASFLITMEQSWK